MSESWTLTRRAFLAATTTTVAAAAFGSGCATTPRVNAARVVPRKHSPNEKLNIAGIGVGGMGHGDIMGCTSENIVAVCDVDWRNAAGAFNDLPNAKKYKDYRKMLDEMGDQIDACTVSTPDHTHAPAAYYAMMLGKHVRVQKPLTHTIAEARLLRRTAEERGLITAMGNQGNCYDELRELCEMIWSGVIGQVTEAHTWTDRPIWPQGIAEPLPGQPVPDTMDWDLWTGAAPFRPYNEGYAPFKWRGWWDFGCGAIGDMACHVMNAAFRSLRLMDAPVFTCEVVMQEGMTAQTPPLKSVIKYTFPARAGMGPLDLYWHDGGLMPAHPEGVSADEPLGEKGNGSLFIGTDGAITCGCNGENSRLLPAARMNDYTRPAAVIPRIPNEDSYQHWIYGIKSGEQVSSHFSYAAPLTEIANMGNVALLARSKIEYDCAQGVIANNSAANALLTKEYRKGWELPC